MRRSAFQNVSSQITKDPYETNEQRLRKVSENMLLNMNTHLELTYQIANEHNTVSGEPYLTTFKLEITVKDEKVIRLN